MAYTEADLTSVQKAIQQLVEGKATVSASWNGRTMTYTRASLPELRSLRTEMMQELSDAAGNERFKLTMNGDKGL
jgi:gpW